MNPAKPAAGTQKIPAASDVPAADMDVSLAFPVINGGALNVNAACVPVTLHRIQRGETGTLQSGDFSDEVAAEAPLTLRVEGHAVAVVMRTPGHDRELAAGFLLTEGVIRSRADLFEISLCPSLSRPAGAAKGEELESEGTGNGPETEAISGGGTVDVMLTNPAAYDAGRLTRHVFTSSSCGVCGKTDLENTLSLSGPALLPSEGPVISPGELFALPARLRQAQAAFASTGGLHGCAWFPVSEGSPADSAEWGAHEGRAYKNYGTCRTYDNAAGTFLVSAASPAVASIPAAVEDAQPSIAAPSAAALPVNSLALTPSLVFEDVGRHNALDKLLGSALLSGRLPLSRGVLLLSGRISFELVQKAATARIPIIAAIGAPSSLAVGYAAAAGITLCGFLRDGRVNLYTHPHRVAVPESKEHP